MLVHTSIIPDDIRHWSDNYFDIAVVIDVLRATTTLLFAFRAGAKRIIFTKSPDEAFSLAQNLIQHSPLLCGERNGEKVPGFDLGNSPDEYSDEIVGGRTLIYASTNGSVAMHLAERVAKNTILASIRNISAAAKFIAENEPKKILLICAGKEKRMSLEDTYCAGMLFDRITGIASEVPADDETSTAQMLYHHFGDDVGEVFSHSIHGKYLSEELALWDDLAAASEIDADDIVLKISNREIII